MQGLWAPAAFGLGAVFLVQWELRQQGLTFSNINTPAVEDSHLSFLVIMAIILFDALVYSVMAWYIEEVYPGRYGVAKPWYFPFQPSYWCGKNRAGAGLCKIPRVGEAMQAKVQEDEQELLCK